LVGFGGWIFVGGFCGCFVGGFCGFCGCVIFATSTVPACACACAFPDMGRWVGGFLWVSFCGWVFVGGFLWVGFVGVLWVGFVGFVGGSSSYFDGFGMCMCMCISRYGTLGHNVQVRPSWLEPHIRLPRARVTGSPSLFSFSPSSPLLPFSSSPSSLLPSLLFSSLSSPSLLSFLSREKEKKKPPAGAGCGAEPQFSNGFHRKHGGRKERFKRRDKGESQMKLNNPPVVSSATDSRWRRDVASTVSAVTTRTRSGARALSFRSGKSLGVLFRKRLIFVPRGLGDRCTAQADGGARWVHQQGPGLRLTGVPIQRRWVHQQGPGRCPGPHFNQRSHLHFGCGFQGNHLGDRVGSPGLTQ
jgi:hypothetical protein